MKKIVLLTLASFLFLSLATTGQEYYLGTAEPPGYQANDQNKLPPAYAPTDLGCLPCAIPEGESDLQDDEDDVTNGGCNSTPPVFTEINIGDVYCGRTNTYLVSGNNTRDTDWYRITITETKTLYWTCIADFDALIAILDDPASDCNYGIITSSTGTTGQVSATLSPGTYYFFITYTDFTGLDAGADYQVVLSEGAPPDPWCASTPSVPLSNWALVVGVLLMVIFMVVRYRRRIA